MTLQMAMEELKKIEKEIDRGVFFVDILEDAYELNEEDYKIVSEEVIRLMNKQIDNVMKKSIDK